MSIELTLTTSTSYAQVILRGSILCISFPYNPTLWNQFSKITDSEWVDKKAWHIPKIHAREISKALGSNAIWKTREELKVINAAFSETEETLHDVLSRIPKTIDTSHLKITPYDFQKVAIAWAATKKGKRANIYGGLLADTMGLGKTLQSIAIATHLKHHPVPEIGPIKRVLVVCPATLKTQWGQEIERFTHEKAVVIDGGKGKGAADRRVEQYRSAKESGAFFTVMNYDLLFQKERLGKKTVKKGRSEETKVIKGDFIDLKCILENEYDMIILDEAQRMRNLAAKKTEAIYQITSPRVRLLLSGTPIEKELQNIFPLIDYMSPNIFSNDKLSLKERFSAFSDQYLVMGWDPYKLKLGIKIQRINDVKNVGHLKQTLAPYILRRTTEEVSDDLPEPTERNIVVGWDETQVKLYDVIKNEIAVLQQKMAEEKEVEKLTLLENETNAFLGYLLSVCNTPQLLFLSDSNYAKRILNKVTKTKNMLEKYNELKKHAGTAKGREALDKFWNDELFMSPKVERLLEMIDEIVIENEHKIVLFSKYETMTRILQQRIAKRLEKTNHRIVMYTGKVDKSCKWKSSLDKEGKDSSGLSCGTCPFVSSCHSRTKSQWFFQNDPQTKVIIASDAAKEGVNLQAGKYLVNVDLPDEFSVFSQRKGRIIRLGSAHKDVGLYNLVTSGGIDEAKYFKLMKQKDVIDLAIEKTTEEEEAIVAATSSMDRELLEDLLKI